MKLAVHRFTLPLKDPFTISRGTQSTQQPVIVELSEDGLSGFGEACAHNYYGIQLEALIQQLEALGPQLDRLGLDTPEALHTLLAPHLDSFALCAIDEAAHDLWGKKLGQPVHVLWGLEPRRAPRSSFTIAIDTPEAMVRKLQAVPRWPIYKIKLGTRDDLHLVQTLRQHTEAPFRVDANCAWSLDETLHIIPQLQELGVEFIEQPMPSDAWDAMGTLYPRAALPLIADESCRTSDDVARCPLRFHGINIKLMKCGGLTPARKMIDEARQLGLKIMLGCMVETTVGISALAQLLPLVDYVDMDGAALLARDIARGVEVIDGKAHFPKGAGHGIELL